jgi:hypothetical protein
MIKTCTQHINEKLGVNSDGEILADFLIDFLMKAEPGKLYVFVKEGEQDLPKDKNVIIIPELPVLEKNVYKVYVNYSDKDMGGIQAFFDPKTSKYTKNGYILHFTFIHKDYKDNIWKHHIYHEIHHGVQFMHMGKKTMLENPKNTKFHLLRTLPNSIIYQEFMQLLYQTIDIEQGAFITQFYGKLKHRKNIKSVEDLQKYFRKRNIHEYNVVHKLAYIDLDQLFKLKMKNPLTGEITPVTNREEMRTFFSLFKKLGKEIARFDSIDDFLKYLSEKGLSKMDKLDIISDKELDATIKKYTKYFNKVGKEMIKKLDKTYDKLLMYYTDKFENPDKYVPREVVMPEPSKKEKFKFFKLPQALKDLIYKKKKDV